MKEMSELELPDNLSYAGNHEWALEGGDGIRVGISDYAQDQLGDIVYVELPQVGDSFEKGDEFGTVESVKAVVELYMPIGGQVFAVNRALEDSPELINTNPYDDGWLIDVKPIAIEEMESLMSKESYCEMLRGKE